MRPGVAIGREGDGSAKHRAAARLGVVEAGAGGGVETLCSTGSYRGDIGAILGVGWEVFHSILEDGDADTAALFARRRWGLEGACIGDRDRRGAGSTRGLIVRGGPRVAIGCERHWPISEATTASRREMEACATRCAHAVTRTVLNRRDERAAGVLQDFSRPSGGDRKADTTTGASRHGG